MGAAREKDQADFDLERFVNMFDEAMTSSDPRVIETLRSLMMIVAMTRPESNDIHSERKGPLRRAFEDMNHLWKRLEQMEQELRQMHQRMSRELGPRVEAWPEHEEKYKMMAASQMAQSIDDDVMRSIARQINSPGLNLARPKGLLKK
jgi:uncharacterized protein YhaN